MLSATTSHLPTSPCSCPPTASSSTCHCGLPLQVLLSFLEAVASHYHAVPYHNFNHVVHVLHATWLVSGAVADTVHTYGCILVAPPGHV